MRLLIAVGALATCVLLFQSFMLPYTSFEFSLLPSIDVPTLVTKPSKVADSTTESTSSAVLVESIMETSINITEANENSAMNIVESSNVSTSSTIPGLNSSSAIETIRGPEIGLLTHEVSFWNQGPHTFVSSTVSEVNKVDKKLEVGNKTDSNTFSSLKQATRVLPKDSSTEVDFSILKAKRPAMSTALSKLNLLLQQSYVSSHPLKARLSYSHERELARARKQIGSVSGVKIDNRLYAPVFRNVSSFVRSYDLMERMLKVYVYGEGEQPIFHKPSLKGIYANEGWFMKLMEGSKQYVVKDPRKAHLFYLPFSSRLLQIALYVPRSHNLKNLEDYLKNYVDKIAAKYPFWNRTGGADHFLVACHDWAPQETRQMRNSIKVLCNADISRGFKLGKDVSLPESYVRSARNPLRDLGGNPASGRSTLAFYAGNMHGSLRPVLLKHWENKDPDMKIIGPMPPGVESKMTYIQHMKNSKYCICPRGYEVNSPRIVEAIFYECVPVIISDRFVPPFFEVLNWEAFCVFVAEKDIPMLKDILISIPEEKYFSMQLGVKKVQQHFLWHHNPVKYDLFKMILHSVWINRLNQVATV